MTIKFLCTPAPLARSCTSRRHPQQPLPIRCAWKESCWQMRPRRSSARSPAVS